MPQFSIFDPRERPFNRPACPNCGCPMWLAIVEPDKPGHEKRSYECPRCQREEEYVVQSGLADKDENGGVWENRITGEYAKILELPYRNPEGRAVAELLARVGARVAGEHRHPGIVERF